MTNRIKSLLNDIFADAEKQQPKKTDTRLDFDISCNCYKCRMTKILTSEAKKELDKSDLDPLYQLLDKVEDAFKTDKQRLETERKLALDEICAAESKIKQDLGYYIATQTLLRHIDKRLALYQ